MTPVFQQLTKRYAKVLGVLMGLAVVSSILLYSGCGMTSSPNIPATPTPTPTPSPTPTPTPDTQPPTSTITSPTAGATVTLGTTVNITGTASDAGGGTVVRVEVSVNGGATFSVGTGTNAWSFSWTPSSPGPATIKSRAADNSGNVQNPLAEITVTVVEPPQVVLMTPADGATNVPVGIAPRATFSKAIDPTSLTDSTVVLQDSAANPVPIKISYDSNAFALALAPKDFHRLRYLETYTVILKGGANEPHITDSTGIPLPSDFSWSFTAGPQPPLPGITLFPSLTTRPDNPAEDDPLPVELGMKFRSDVDGLITGVKYYKGGPEAGNTHTLNLWTGTGTKLLTAKFNNEPNHAVWMLALITPIPIQANTTYVVSYFAPQGHYAADHGYFASTGVDNGPLHALQNGVDGSNGVRLYGPQGGFPTEASNATNYYVDVVFNDPTISAPQVMGTSPATGTTNIPIGVSPRVTFSEHIDLTTLTASTLQMTDTANNPVPITWAFESNGFTLTIKPAQPLKPGQAYTLTLKGGFDGPHVTDTTGTPLAADYAWSFTTEPPPQVSMLGDWGTKGANFIARQAGNRLASLLGISHASSVPPRLP